MHETKKINLEIFSDKEFEFYSSIEQLLTIGDNTNVDVKDVLKTLQSSIVYEQELLEKLPVITEIDNPENPARQQIMSIYSRLELYKKNSPFYKVILCSNFEEFQLSNTYNKLSLLLLLLNLRVMLKGKEHSLVYKIIINKLTTFISIIPVLIAKALEKGLNSAVNKAFRPQIIQQIVDEIPPAKASFSEKDGLRFQSTELTIEKFEYFIENEGKLKKVNIDFEQEEATLPYFIAFNEELVKIDVCEDEIEVSFYENTEKPLDEIEILDLLIKTSVKLPTEELEKNIQEKDDGNFELDFTKVNINPIIDGLVGHDEEKEEEEQLQLSESDVEKTNEFRIELFSTFDEMISSLIKNPSNKSETLSFRDAVICAIYDVLYEEHPTISNHVRYTITGVICSEMQVLDNEDQHDSSDRYGSFNKYLKSTVENVIKKNR